MHGVCTGALDRRTMEGISTAGAGPLIGAPNRPPRVILPVAVKLYESYMWTTASSVLNVQQTVRCSSQIAVAYHGRSEGRNTRH